MQWGFLLTRGMVIVIEIYFRLNFQYQRMIPQLLDRGDIYSVLAFDRWHTRDGINVPWQNRWSTAAFQQQPTILNCQKTVTGRLKNKSLTLLSWHYFFFFFFHITWKVCILVWNLAWVGVLFRLDYVFPTASTAIMNNERIYANHTANYITS